MEYKSFSMIQCLSVEFTHVYLHEIRLRIRANARVCACVRVLGCMRVHACLLACVHARATLEWYRYTRIQPLVPCDRECFN